jgi:endonuclease YncB( thermonuclease family)
MSEIVPFDPKRKRGKSAKRSAWARPEAYGHHHSKPKRGWGASFVTALVVLPLLGFTTALSWNTPVALHAMAQAAPVADHEAASFVRCGAGPRVDCVVDGDTFWYRGAKIRIADINTPEVSAPQCAGEAALGARATGRLQALLNAGPFTLESIDRDRDRYGRLLRTVTRGGESLGLVLVGEGLAEEWRGHRGSWC